MAEAVLMPKLGMTMDKGTILRWLKKEGEPVQAGEPLLEVMTDKINIEVESEISGTLLKVYYPEEVEVPVNRVIAYIGKRGKRFRKRRRMEKKRRPHRRSRRTKGLHRR